MIMKRLRSTLMSVAILLLLLVIVMTPVTANYNGELPPEPPPEAEPPPVSHDTNGGHEGKFLVIICASHDTYDWVEEWQHGMTLAESVSQVGTCSTCVACPTTTYMIEIPEGTVVEGYYPAQGRVVFLEIKVSDGHLSFSPNLKFSQPATLYEMVDEEWVEVLSFSEVLDGEAR